MRRQMRTQKSMFIKGAALSVALCMIIGNTYIPVFAEEDGGSELPVLESENSTSGETTTEEDKQDKPEVDPEESEKTDKGEQEKTEETPNEDSKEEEPTPDEGVEEEEPETEEKIDEENVVSDDDIKLEEPEPEENNDELEMPEIINVMVPASYLLALNPYGLSIRIGKDEVTTEQVISGNYGIVNKSSTDQIVTVSLTVEDMNEGELVFVDSAEGARNAEEGVYAVYLAAVPADEEEVLVDGSSVDGSVTGEDLQNVKMAGAQEQAVTLYGGTNQIAFKLSGAVYNLEDDEEVELDNLDDDLNREPEMTFDGLAPDGAGVTAYTFCGAMNPNAAWEKLQGGIKLSVVYTYQAADGSEEVVEGTGAMIHTD